MEAWFAPAEQIIHHAIPPNAVADWDSTVIPRYGSQEDTAIGSMRAATIWRTELAIGSEALKLPQRYV